MRQSQWKENFMRYQRLNRIAACAAIITLCIASAGFLPGQLAARNDSSETSSVTPQHQSRPVRWVPGFNVLHQLEYTLAQRFGLYWFLPGCWRCDLDTVEIHNQIPCAGRISSPPTDDE